ncbi:MAG TPA: response regulator transcription factor [Stellaceae bacterium]|nr:response regulator transcription factor [Stellaceae bacterium]
MIAPGANGSIDPAAAVAASDSTIAVVDSSRLRRECLRLAMAQHSPDRNVVEATTAADVVQLAAGGTRFDLVLMGAATADHIELRQIEALRRALPDTPVVVVAEADNPQRARQILGTGARGFLPVSLSLRVLMGAIDLVLAGGVYVPSSLIEGGPYRPSADPALAEAAEPCSELTRRQRDVLALISQGKSNKLIADALSMSESTVKAHVKQIIKRLNVANRTQAALVATGRGYFAPQPRAGNGGAEPAAGD